MPLRYPKSFAGLLVSVDAILIALVYRGVIEIFRAETAPPVRALFDPSARHTQILFICIAAWFISAAYVGLYQPNGEFRLPRQIWQVARAGTLGVVIIIVAFAVLWSEAIPRAMLASFWAGSIGLIAASRGAWLALLQVGARRLVRARHIVIVGANGRAERLYRTLRGSSSAGVQVIGYLDDEPHGEHAGMPATVPYLGRLDEFADLLRQRVVDEVQFALPLKSQYRHINDMIDLCEDLGVEIKVLVDCFETRLSRAEVTLENGLPLLSLFPSPGRSETLWIKRAIDMVGAAALLVVMAPVMAAIALAVKLTSPGPVLFRQQRVGYHNRRFTLYKFRSMQRDAERLRESLEERNELAGPVFKIRDDPRMTPIGRWLRAYSLDELPQLWNVLRGDMSLVGPRPPLPTEVDRYELTQRRRLSMLPGLTGLWQVTGRNQVPFERWVELDLRYIDQWSLSLDFSILMRTIPAVISGRGM